MKFYPFLPNVSSPHVNVLEFRLNRASLPETFGALFLFAGTVLFLAGCSGNRQFGHPSLEPAPQNIQARRAARFDPYPDPNLGPEIHGARPHCFMNPSPERTNTTKLTY